MLYLQGNIKHLAQCLARRRLNKFHPPYSDKSQYQAFIQIPILLNESLKQTNFPPGNAQQTVLFTVKNAAVPTQTSFFPTTQPAAKACTRPHSPILPAEPKSKGLPPDSCSPPWETMHTRISVSVTWAFPEGMGTPTFP